MVPRQHLPDEGLFGDEELGGYGVDVEGGAVWLKERTERVKTCHTNNWTTRTRLQPFLPSSWTRLLRRRSYRRPLGFPKLYNPFDAECTYANASSFTQSKDYTLARWLAHPTLNFHSQHQTTPFSEMYSSRNLALGDATSVYRDQGMASIMGIHCNPLFVYRQLDDSVRSSLFLYPLFSSLIISTMSDEA